MTSPNATWVLVGGKKTNKKTKTETMTNAEMADKRQTWKTGVTGRCGKGGEGRDDMSVLQGSQVKLVCRKLKWHGGDSDRCSVCWGLKRVHGAETWPRRARWQTHVVHAAKRGPFPNATEIRSGGRVGMGKKKNDVKFISHPINVTEDTQHNISACRDPRGPWEMNICPIDLSHLIQS